MATLKDKITKNKRYTIYSCSSSRLLMPRCSIVLALCIRWASRAFLKESRPFSGKHVKPKTIEPLGINKRDHFINCNYI